MARQLSPEVGMAKIQQASMQMKQIWAQVQQLQGYMTALYDEQMRVQEAYMNGYMRSDKDFRRNLSRIDGERSKCQAKIDKLRVQYDKQRLIFELQDKYKVRFY